MEAGGSRCPPESRLSERTASGRHIGYKDHFYSFSLPFLAIINLLLINYLFMSLSFHLGHESHSLVKSFVRLDHRTRYRQVR